jgi:DNA phosphorothioation-associated putative methyltransferase
MTGRECSYSQVEPFSDGLITNRNTFQKHYEPAEFHSFLEDALETEAVPIEPGICYVFRRLEDQLDFVSRRTKRAIDWEQISQRLRFLHARAPRLTVYERHRELFDDYWHALLEFGRPPRPGEYGRYEEIRSACGSGNKAAQLFVRKYGEEPLEEARERRKEDLLVYLSGGEFQRRRAGFTRLPARLRADVKAFFGTYAAACDEARELLFTAGDPGELEFAAEELEFGWIDVAEGHFTIHRSLLGRLPPLLRIYVECGARLFGDPRQADLIKLHLRSKKLTFLHFADFNAPLPVLETRTKIDLRRLLVTVIDHTAGPEHQLLYFKERFLSPDHPDLPKLQAFSKRLRKLGVQEGLLGSNDRNAPSKEVFEAFLARNRLSRNLTRLPAPREDAP